MTRYKRKGRVDITDLNTPPEKHELATAKFFAKLGKNIRFIQPRNIKGIHTPDFYMDGKAWETKSPIGKSKNVFERNFKKATKQSPNIIIDLRRSQIQDQTWCITKIKRQSSSRKIKKLKLILKDGTLLDIK